MSPVQTASREQRFARTPSVPSGPPADVLFAPDKDALREIVVDWQLPSEMEQERR